MDRKESGSNKRAVSHLLIRVKFARSLDGHTDLNCRSASKDEIVEASVLH